MEKAPKNRSRLEYKIMIVLKQRQLSQFYLILKEQNNLYIFTNTMLPIQASHGSLAYANWPLHFMANQKYRQKYTPTSNNDSDSGDIDNEV